MQPPQLDVVRSLLTTRRVLSLAVVVEGAPVIGLLPFAVTPDVRALVVHASRLARHTRGLTDGAPFDALLHDPDDSDPMQVNRVTLRGTVRAIAGDPTALAAARDVYLGRFPEAEPITSLGDFAFFRLEIEAGRVVTGFASAANVTRETLEQLKG
jgi:putative heme iron utilization protein